MQHVADSIRRAVENANYPVALAAALTMPDICGWIETGDGGSRSRAVQWWNRWVVDRYTVMRLDGTGEVFLSGSDAYALRCSYLHQGSADITTQGARDVLDGFHFVVPPGSDTVIHNNRFNHTLQLQVDQFCGDVADAVEAFVDSMLTLGEPPVLDRLRQSMVLHDLRQPDGSIRL